MPEYMFWLLLTLGSLAICAYVGFGIFLADFCDRYIPFSAIVVLIWPLATVVIGLAIIYLNIMGKSYEHKGS